MTYAYEVHGIGDDGRCGGVVCFEQDGADEKEADARALAVAEYYAKLWKQDAAVRLYRTPEANESHVPSFVLWPGRVVLVAEIRRSCEGQDHAKA